MKSTALIRFALSFTLILSAATGCGVGVVSVEKGCTKRQCEVQAEQCRIQANDDCNRCTRLWLDTGASYDLDDVCASSCGNHHCDFCPQDVTQSACVQTGYIIHLPEENQELKTACEAANARYRRCNPSTTALNRCSTIAAVERPELASAYSCAAGIACGDDLSTCAPVGLTPSTLGTELGTTETAVCSRPASEDVVRFFNEEGAWMRPEAVNAVRTCTTTTTCDDFAQCVNAWLDKLVTR